MVDHPLLVPTSPEDLEEVSPRSADLTEAAAMEGTCTLWCLLDARAILLLSPQLPILAPMPPPPCYRCSPGGGCRPLCYHHAVAGWAWRGIKPRLAGGQAIRLVGGRALHPAQGPPLQSGPHSGPAYCCCTHPTNLAAVSRLTFGGALRRGEDAGPRRALLPMGSAILADHSQWDFRCLILTKHNTSHH